VLKRDLIVNEKAVLYLDWNVGEDKTSATEAVAASHSKTKAIKKHHTHILKGTE